MKLLPRSLFGRLVLILVSGMLAAQALTSSIWYDMRHGQVLEIPSRLIATRLADVVRLVHSDPAQADVLIKLLDTPRFRLTLSVQASDVTSSISDSDQATERLLNKVLSEKTGYTQNLHLLSLKLLDAEGQHAGLSTLLSSRPVVGQFLIDLRLPDGRWLQVQATEEQGWTSTSPMDLLFDYVMRIYLLRVLVLVIIALVAVRLAIRPLNALAKAAEALGRDIQRPPLALDGPTEVRRAAQAFNAMQQRLIANIAERTRFLAAISHDLRSPITRLRLRTEMLDDNRTRLGSAAGLKVIRRSTSPSAVCSALYCGRLASWVATLTTSAGRTKLNKVCCPAGAASNGAANNRAKTAGSVRIM